jgi:hypothetical protein
MVKLVEHDWRDVWKKLDAQEKTVRREIGGLPVSKVTQAAGWLQRSEDLHRRYVSLRGELTAQLENGEMLLKPVAEISEQNSDPIADSDEPKAKPQGGKGRGRECRAAYIAQLAKKGERLTRVRGALYRNVSGATVGIAYAMMGKNSWFLGLPAGEFTEAVLLCELPSNKIQAIHLPSKFIESYGRRLPVSLQYNQAKFNIQFRGGRYFLSLKETDDQDLTAYLSGQPFVCARPNFRDMI